jgi:hypothetical protein
MAACRAVGVTSPDPYPGAMVEVIAASPLMRRTILLTSREVVAFGALTALLAILADAAIGHGLLWENDPYWTYWITKTFLIGTIFTLGTAWLGVGIGVGAVVAVVHTVVLTIYYWTFSPIGLPSAPEWLDLEHTWLTGVPIHFGVIYLGYLVALFVWRRRSLVDPAALQPVSTALSALVATVVAVILAGVLVTILLGEYPGFTWFLVRILITFPLVFAWWSVAGRDPTAAVVGGIAIALAWGAYGQFLGPIGLPQEPLRVLSSLPPPAQVHWLDYTDQWLVSLPVYVVVLVVTLLFEARVRPRPT